MLAKMARLTARPNVIDLQRYTRAGFAAYLRIIKVGVYGDWAQTMVLLHSHLIADQSLVIGSNSLRELYVHLDLFGSGLASI